MVGKGFVSVLLLFLFLASLAYLHTVSVSSQDVFTGVCVYSSSSFSVLSNGSSEITVGKELEVGRVYTLFGRLRGSRMDVSRVERSSPDFPLEKVEGFYWVSGGCYLLTEGARIKLGFCLNVSKGSMLSARGIFHGRKFYPVEYRQGRVSSSFREGLPVVVEGVVMYSGKRTILWNGTSEIVLYLPHGFKLTPGKRVRVLGLARFYSIPSLLVGSKGDVHVLGYATERPIGSAKVGEIGRGLCRVISRNGKGLKLDCFDKPLIGFMARVGDEVAFRALVRRGSLLCLSCEVVGHREDLPNSICGGEGVVRVYGGVEWVKVYRNGFGLANVSFDDCWILLKLRKSLKVSLRANETVTAYGRFTLYRGMPALEIDSGEDICSGKC